MLTSQGLVLATAMAVSAATIFLLDHFKDKYSNSTPLIQENQDLPLDGHKALKSCLSSGNKKREIEGKKNKKKKKRVRFADDVKDSKGNGEIYGRQHKKCAQIQNSSCGNQLLEIQKMPPNRRALYSGILKGRVQRMEYSY